MTREEIVQTAQSVWPVDTDELPIDDLVKFANLISRHDDDVATMKDRIEEMRNYIAKHTRIDSLAKVIEDATRDLSVAIVQADYHLALVDLEKAVRASAGTGLNGKAFAAELERVARAKSSSNA